jgi:hypothetical protein
MERLRRRLPTQLLGSRPVAWPACHVTLLCHRARAGDAICRVSARASRHGSAAAAAAPRQPPGRSLGKVCGHLRAGSSSPLSGITKVYAAHERKGRLQGPITAARNGVRGHSVLLRRSRIGGLGAGFDFRPAASRDIATGSRIGWGHGCSSSQRTLSGADLGSHARWTSSVAASNGGSELALHHSGCRSPVRPRAHSQGQGDWPRVLAGRVGGPGQWNSLAGPRELRACLTGEGGCASGGWDQ